MVLNTKKLVVAVFVVAAASAAVVVVFVVVKLNVVPVSSQRIKGLKQ